MAGGELSILFLILDTAQSTKAEGKSQSISAAA